MASSGAERVSAMCSILMHILERMARRLEIFYSKLAQHTIYQPVLEHNPARTRWGLVRRRIKDGSFFVLAEQSLQAKAQTQPQQTVDFHNVLSRVQQTIQHTERPNGTPKHPKPLNERHLDRAQIPANAPSAVETYENSSAARRMSAFIDSNKRAMRRLSKLPPNASELVLEQFPNLREGHRHHTGSPRGAIPTPPSSSRESSKSPSRVSMASGMGVEDVMMRLKLNRRASSRSASVVSGMRSRGGIGPMQGIVTPERTRSNSPTQSELGHSQLTMMERMMHSGKLNLRGSFPTRSLTEDARSVRERSRGRSPSSVPGNTISHRARASTTSLRSFQLGTSRQPERENQFAPTF